MAESFSLNNDNLFALYLARELKYALGTWQDGELATLLARL